MRRLWWAWFLGALVVSGCSAPPLSPQQRSALIQRVRDSGEVGINAVRARDRAFSALAAATGKTDPGPSDGTIAFLRGENAALCSDVAASLR